MEARRTQLPVRLLVVSVVFTVSTHRTSVHLNDQASLTRAVHRLFHSFPQGKRVKHHSFPSEQPRFSGVFVALPSFRSTVSLSHPRVIDMRLVVTCTPPGSSRGNTRTPRPGPTQKARTPFPSATRPVSTAAQPRSLATPSDRCERFPAGQALGCPARNAAQRLHPSRLNPRERRRRRSRGHNRFRRRGGGGGDRRQRRGFSPRDRRRGRHAQHGPRRQFAAAGQVEAGITAHQRPPSRSRWAKRRDNATIRQSTSARRVR
jgi:hypothetical protein